MFLIFCFAGSLFYKYFPVTFHLNRLINIRKLKVQNELNKIGLREQLSVKKDCKLGLYLLRVSKHCIPFDEKQHSEVVPWKKCYCSVTFHMSKLITTYSEVSTTTNILIFLSLLMLNSNRNLNIASRRIQTRDLWFWNLILYR